MIRPTTFRPCLCLAFVGACGLDAPEDALAERSLEVDPDCSRWRCGYNTSEINGKSLQELHLDGQANADGVEIVGFLPPAGLLLDYELEVEGDELVAVGGLLGEHTLRGNQLLSGIILLRLELGLVVSVIISGYEEVDAWAAGADPLAAYALTYADLDDPLLERSVCKGTLVDPLQAAVVILAGERYDLDANSVIPDQDRWFTLACAGSAAAKMALMGYGPNADFAGQGGPASVEQRQATLKMITADYCGGGTSYTSDGVALRWENQAGTVVDAEPYGESEAIWTADGALCLDTPRWVDASEVACELPSCDGLSLDEGEWASWGP